MHLDLVREVWDSSLPRNGKVVLLTMTTLARKNRVVVPIPELARSTGYSERHVQRTLRVLCSSDVISLHRQGGSKDRAPNVYTLHLDAVPSNPDAE